MCQHTAPAWRLNVGLGNDELDRRCEEGYGHCTATTLEQIAFERDRSVRESLREQRCLTQCKHGFTRSKRAAYGIGSASSVLGLAVAEATRPAPSMSQSNFDQARRHVPSDRSPVKRLVTPGARRPSARLPDGRTRQASMQAALVARRARPRTGDVSDSSTSRHGGPHAGQNA